MADVDIARKVVEAWEALPGGRNYSMKVVESWLSVHMAPMVNEMRAIIDAAPAPQEHELLCARCATAYFSTAVGNGTGPTVEQHVGTIDGVLRVVAEQPCERSNGEYANSHNRFTRIHCSPPEPIPTQVRNFLGKVQGVCMGVAMSGRDHPNPDEVLIELFNEAQAILFPATSEGRS